MSLLQVCCQQLYGQSFDLGTVEMETSKYVELFESLDSLGSIFFGTFVAEETAFEHYDLPG